MTMFYKILLIGLFKCLILTLAFGLNGIFLPTDTALQLTTTFTDDRTNILCKNYHYRFNLRTET